MNTWNILLSLRKVRVIQSNGYATRLHCLTEGFLEEASSKHQKGITQRGEGKYKGSIKSINEQEQNHSLIKDL